MEKVAPTSVSCGSCSTSIGYKPSLYGHFGQGCIHCRIPFDLYTRSGLEKYRHFMEEATDLVVRFGGSLSGEHGDGQARANCCRRCSATRADPGIPRIQIDLGSRLADEPRQEDRRLPL